MKAVLELFQTVPPNRFLRAKIQLRRFPLRQLIL
jgi:hypothetical protein